MHWQLQPLDSMPTAAIDPHFPVFKREFGESVKSSGFLFQEAANPPQIPLELRPNRPDIRFRKSPGTWPLFQIGPGILAVNNVPPYGGWSNFQGIFESGLKILWETYPIPEKYLKIKKVELHYINGFLNIHGFDSFSNFVNQQLQVSLDFPRDLFSESPIVSESQEFKIEVRFHLDFPEQSQGIIKLNPGKVKGEKAVILELLVSKATAETVPRTPEEIKAWFFGGHSVLRNWFEILTSEGLKRKMGPVTDLKG